MRAVLVVLVCGCYGGSAPPPVAAPPKPVDQTAKHVRTAADPLGFLPIDSELVAHLDAVQLRGSGLWARFEPVVMAKVGSRLDTVRVMCGFEPMPMIASIAFGMRGLGTPDASAVLVIRGMPRAQVMPCVEKAIAAEPAAGSIDRGVITVRSAPNEPPFFFAFADARTLVMVGGAGASVQRLRDVLDVGAPLRGSEAFSEMFTRIESTRTAWFFLNSTSKVFDRFAGVGVHPRSFFGSVDVANILVAKLVLRLNNISEAATLAQTLQSQIGPAKSFVERLEIVAEEGDVVVDLGLTEDQLSLIANFI